MKATTAYPIGAAQFSAKNNGMSRNITFYSCNDKENLQLKKQLQKNENQKLKNNNMSEVCKVKIITGTHHNIPEKLQ